jgi:DNA modification methylase
MRKIKVEYIPVDKLKDWTENPRLITEGQYLALAKNVRKFGIVDPLIVDQHCKIVGGHQRIKVLRQLGMKTVPVVKLPLSRREFKVLNLALNKISGEWDQTKLAPLLEEFAALPELDLTGFSRQEVNLIIEDFLTEQGTSEDIVSELPKKGLSHVGDLYKLGKHRLICGDAAESAVWKKLLAGHSASVVITDPPYGVKYELSNKFVLDKLRGGELHHKSWGKIERDENPTAALNVMPQIFSNLADNGVAYFTCGTKLLVALANWLDANHIRYAPFLVWDKGFAVITWERYHAAHELMLYCGPGSYPTRGRGGIKSRWFGPRNETTVWHIPIEPSFTRSHPTQKPVELFMRPIEYHTEVGDIVYEPFLGSGTQIIAAEKLSRRCFAMEKEPLYVDVARFRWEAFTGEKAKRVEEVK